MYRIILLCFFVFTLFQGCNTIKEQEKYTTPNILVVLLDDMGFSDLGCFGGEIETPAVDKLAEKGLRFCNFHNNAKCEPSRASLLSGLYCYQAGNRSLSNAATIADVARSAGYYTFATGKWHLEDHPMDRGFDHFFGFLEGACDYFTGSSYFILDREKYDVPEDFYTTNYIMNYSLEFIAESKETNEPFLGYIAFNAPHSPIQAPEAVVQKYYGVYKAGWDKLREERFARMKETGVILNNSRLSPRPDFIPAWEDLSGEQKAFEIFRMATYAACIDMVDQNMARLTDFLKENDLYENTVILFMSDNGASPFERTKESLYPSWDSRSRYRAGVGWAWLSNTPFRWFKQNQHEGGISSPFIAFYPEGINGMSGKTNHELSHFIDVMPTIVELIGADYPEEIRNHEVVTAEGLSLVSAFTGKPIAQRNFLYQQWSTNRALFKGDYKICSFRANEWELYNIVEDRSELINLAKEKPWLLEEMVKTWRDIAANKDHLSDQLMYILPSDELEEKWGDRQRDDILKPEAIDDFYKNVYPNLGFEVEK